MDRLSPLILLPPALGPSSPETESHRDRPIGADGRMTVHLADGRTESLGLPLFWHEPLWHRAPVDVADIVAGAVADQGVLVTSLLSEISNSQSPSTFHSPSTDDDSGSSDPQRRHRMIPYRAERYGLSAEDFDEAAVVEVRLAAPRNQRGRFGYTLEQLKRWEAVAEDPPWLGGSSIRSATFPPDVPSLDELRTKLDQLRVLSPDGVIMVSMYPHRLDHELPAILNQGFDGVILKCDDDYWDGLSLATITRRARKWMEKISSHDPALWIVPGQISPVGAAKLIELGATAVAIDRWCERIIDRAAQAIEQSAAARMGYSQPRETTLQEVMAIVAEEIADPIEQMLSVVDSMSPIALNQRLASTDARWAKTFGIPLIQFGN